MMGEHAGSPSQDAIIIPIDCAENHPGPSALGPKRFAYIAEQETPRCGMHQNLQPGHVWLPTDVLAIVFSAFIAARACVRETNVNPYARHFARLASRRPINDCRFWNLVGRM
eukprot:5973663-Pleurochrysis_carterae.AAC.2